MSDSIEGLVFDVLLGSSEVDSEFTRYRLTILFALASLIQLCSDRIVLSKRGLLMSTSAMSFSRYSSTLVTSSITHNLSTLSTLSI